MRVDHRPYLERRATRMAMAGLLLIAGCALLGGYIAAEAVIHLTTPKGQRLAT